MLKAAWALACCSPMADMLRALVAATEQFPALMLVPPVQNRAVVLRELRWSHVPASRSPGGSRTSNWISTKASIVGSSHMRRQGLKGQADSCCPLCCCFLLLSGIHRAVSFFSHALSLSSLSEWNQGSPIQPSDVWFTEAHRGTAT